MANSWWIIGWKQCQYIHSLIISDIELNDFSDLNMSNGTTSANTPDETESNTYGSTPGVARGDNTHTGGGDGQFDFSFSTSLVRDSLDDKHKHISHSINTPQNNERVASRKLSFCRELTGKNEKEAGFCC